MGGASEPNKFALVFDAPVDFGLARLTRTRHAHKDRRGRLHRHNFEINIGST